MTIQEIEVGSVTGLWTYPIKGVAGTSVECLEVDDIGPVNDRRFMIVDENGKFLTQRALPKMAVIQGKLSQGSLVGLSCGDESFGEIEFGTKPGTASVWKDSVDVVFANESTNRFLSDFLQQPVRLAKMAPGKKRIRQGSARPEPFSVSFADGYPFLLTNEQSLIDLNRRLTTPVPMNRFRPNIVISSSEAFAEDRWVSIKIGYLTFPAIKDCVRCKVTTIDQDSGEVRGKEPLAELSKYRNFGEGPVFGVNLIHASNGKIKVGDKVFAREKAE